MSTEEESGMTSPHLALWPTDTAQRFHRSEASAVVGSGDETWKRAAADILRWKVKTRSGFSVDDEHPVSEGAEPTITARAVGISVREPVRVVSVVDTEDRVGFAYRTLPGHPVAGEEAFIVHRDGEHVVITVRSLTRASPRLPWRQLFPCCESPKSSCAAGTSGRSGSRDSPSARLPA